VSVSELLVLFVAPGVAMRLMVAILTAVLAAVLFSDCGSSPSGAARSGSTDYKTIPLKEYKYTPAAINSGTEINILGFSGGLTNGNGSIYYSQFVGTEKTTGDTVRILAAWIAVPSENGGAPTFTSASLYDGQKGVRDASFLIPDENQRMIINMAAGLSGGDDDTAKINKAINDTAVAKNENVILPDEVPLFKGNYKTAVGVMNFKQQPW